MKLNLTTGEGKVSEVPAYLLDMSITQLDNAPKTCDNIMAIFSDQHTILRRTFIALTKSIADKMEPVKK